jgi:hypothetical protein
MYDVHNMCMIYMHIRMICMLYMHLMHLLSKLTLMSMLYLTMSN